MDNENYLVVTLSSKLKLITSLTIPERGDEPLIIDSVEYKEAVQGEFNGFYDWLRNSDERIIGVRYHPFEDSYFLFDTVKSLEYCRVGDCTASFDVYFSNALFDSIDESSSDDQAFGGNKIYRSIDGEYIITFDITELRENFMQFYQTPLEIWRGI